MTANLYFFWSGFSESGVPPVSDGIVRADARVTIRRAPVRLTVDYADSRVTIRHAPDLSQQ